MFERSTCMLLRLNILFYIYIYVLGYFQTLFNFLWFILFCIGQIYGTYHGLYKLVFGLRLSEFVAFSHSLSYSVFTCSPRSHSFPTDTPYWRSPTPPTPGINSGDYPPINFPIYLPPAVCHPSNLSIAPSINLRMDVLLPI